MISMITIDFHVQIMFKIVNQATIFLQDFLGSSNGIFSNTRPLDPPFTKIKRGLLFEFSKRGLLLERGPLLVWVRYSNHNFSVEGR